MIIRGDYTPKEDAWTVDKIEALGFKLHKIAKESWCDFIGHGFTVSTHLGTEKKFVNHFKLIRRTNGNRLVVISAVIYTEDEFNLFLDILVNRFKN